jgi:hypothetical protein
MPVGRHVYAGSAPLELWVGAMGAIVARNPPAPRPEMFAGVLFGA